jgi:putative aldouronate transport system permease protein
MQEQKTGLNGLLNRIWKYKLHYILVIPAVFWLFVFKILPFINAIIIPFKDYKIFEGLFRSPWVGLDNFNKLFESPHFLSVLSNTLAIKFGYIFVGSTLSLIIVLTLSQIRIPWLRNAFVTWFLIPYFIPSVVLVSVVMLLLSPVNSPLFQFDTLILGQPVYFRPLLIVLEVIKTSGIPIILGLAAITATYAAHNEKEGELSSTSFVQMQFYPALKAIVAFMLLQLSTVLSTNFELVHSLVNPLVYSVGDTLDTFQFRTGFMNMDLGMSGTIWFIQFLVQLIFTLLAYLCIRGFLKQNLFSSFLNHSRTKAPNGNSTGNVLGIGIAGMYSLVILLPLFFLFIYPWGAGRTTSDIRIGYLLAESNFMKYMFIYFFAVLFNLLITVTLAFPLTVKDLPGRNLYKAFLLLVLVMGGGAIHEYLYMKDLGMINTIFPAFISGVVTMINVFVLKSIFNSKYAGLKEQASVEGRGELHSLFFLFIPKIWKPLIALGVLQFVLLWNSYYTSLIYINDPSLHSPVSQFRMMSMGGQFMNVEPGDPMILMYGAIISLPSILLLFIFRSFLTSEVFISQSRRL